MPEFLKRPFKLYLDTSVPSHLFADDVPEKKNITESLFDSEIRSQYEFYVSVVVLREIERAPFHMQKELKERIIGIPILELSKDADHLAEAYIEAGVLSRASVEDAQHVAIATINNLDAVVSWNFKHLVNLRRIKLINAVNEQMGYKHIEIVSPHEVINYEI